MKSNYSKIAAITGSIALSSLFLFGGCATKASGPLFQRLENPPTDKAIIYVYRPYKNETAALSNLAVFDNGSVICKNVYMNGYCYHFADPGKHIFHTDTTAIDKKLEMDVKPGETVYLKATHQCGLWGCTYILTPIKKSVAAKEILDYKLQ